MRRGRRGVAAGPLNTSRQVGAAVGLAAGALVEGHAGALAPVVQRTLETFTGTGVRFGFLASAVFVAAGALAALVPVRPKGAAE